jgi:hypothetical protein
MFHGCYFISDSHIDWNRQWRERGWWRGGACGTRLRSKTFVTSGSEMRSAQSRATPQWSSPWLSPRRGVSPGSTRDEKHRPRGRNFVANISFFIIQGGGVARCSFGKGAIMWSRDLWFVTHSDRVWGRLRDGSGASEGCGPVLRAKPPVLPRPIMKPSSPWLVLSAPPPRIRF